MNELLEAAEVVPGGRATAPRSRDWRPLGAALAVGVIYYAGAKIGLALTFEPYPIAVLWPPNALLFAALLLAPARWWWILILGAFPAHLLAELQGGVPLAMVLCWFVSNVSEALIGALFVRRFSLAPTGLGTVRAVMVFCSAAVLAPFLSSFLDAGFVRHLEWGHVEYWRLWRARFLTNMLATLTFVPVLITWAGADPTHIKNATRVRFSEASTLITGLLVVSVIAFDSNVSDREVSSALLYLPLPFLLWAALRFGPPLTATCFTVMAFLVIWGAGHGHGPFLEAATHENALPIQLFLISVAVPVLFLAALMEERRMADLDLRLSEERFSSAFRFSPDAKAISRQSDGRIIDVNDRWLALFGYAHEQLARGEIAPLALHVEDAQRAKLAQVIRHGVDARDLEMTIRACGGTERQTHVSIRAVELAGEPCLITIVHDVTEQRRAELEAREQRRQLTHLTRVASLTDFSGALAHELNQPLTAILSNAQAAQRFLSRTPPNISEIRSILSEIAEADKRAGLVIHRLRVLLKKGEEEFIRIDLNQLVIEVLDFVRGEFVTHNVEVRSSYAPDLPPLNGDRVQLQQLVLNLVSNACEAMLGNPEREKVLRVTTLHGHDGTAQVVVTDTGPGIPPSQLVRIFEPFVTTKPSGLGLGLSICRTIAAAHGGSLTADNYSGGGASFRLVLPPVSAAPR